MASASSQIQRPALLSQHDRLLGHRALAAGDPRRGAAHLIRPPRIRLKRPAMGRKREVHATGRRQTHPRPRPRIDLHEPVGAVARVAFVLDLCHALVAQLLEQPQAAGDDLGDLDGLREARDAQSRRVLLELAPGEGEPPVAAAEDPAGVELVVAAGNELLHEHVDAARAFERVGQLRRRRAPQGLAADASHADMRQRRLDDDGVPERVEPRQEVVRRAPLARRVVDARPARRLDLRALVEHLDHGAGEGERGPQAGRRSDSRASHTTPRAASSATNSDAVSPRRSELASERRNETNASGSARQSGETCGPGEPGCETRRRLIEVHRVALRLRRAPARARRRGRWRRTCRRRRHWWSVQSWTTHRPVGRCMRPRPLADLAPALIAVPSRGRAGSGGRTRTCDTRIMIPLL